MKSVSQEKSCVLARKSYATSGDGCMGQAKSTQVGRPQVHMVLAKVAAEQEYGQHGSDKYSHGQEIPFAS